MTYPSVLPKVFPYVISGPEKDVLEIIAGLIHPREGMPNGSSFAVTSDAKRGCRRIWLSKVSYDTLVERGVIKR